MKMSQPATFVLGMIFGFILGSVMRAILGVRSSDSGQSDRTQGLGADYSGGGVVVDGEELDPQIHGEFRGPENPAPGTEKWYEIRVEEAAENLPANAATKKVIKRVIENNEEIGESHRESVEDAAKRVLGDE